MVTFAQATTAQSSAVIRTASLALAASLGVNVAGWDDFAPQRAMFEIDARALSAEQRIRVQLAYAGFLTTAALAGDDFFDEALTWFDEVRIPASAAVWEFAVTCAATAGPYAIAANSKELIAAADDGTLFESTNPQARVLSPGTTTTVQFTCQVAGIIGNQNSGNVTHFVVAQPGLTVTNASPGSILTGGRDIETTGEATVRALGKWGTIGAGWTRTSFDYLIPRATPTVNRWRVRDDNPTGPGTIQVIQANANGPASTPENTSTRTYLMRPDVMTLGTGGLTVISAVDLPVAVTGTLYSDGTNSNLLANARSALDQVRARFPIGGDQDGRFRLDLLIAILMGGAWPASDPLTITDLSGAQVRFVLPGFNGAKYVALSSPAADVVFSLSSVMTIDYSGLVVA